jgi:tripartite ATP-independent transporter DctP family solute receptor
MLNRGLLQVLFALITLGCLAGLLQSRAERADYTIRIAFLASKDDEDYEGSVAFKRHVEERSGGRVAVQIYPSGQFCGNERECIEGLASGILEMHQTTIGGFAAIFPPAQVFDLPYVFEDDREAECVFDGPMVEQLGERILAMGLGMRLMAVGNTGGWRSFATTTREVRRPEDLRALDIRTTPSALEQQIVRELGAYPTPIPWSEVYTALGIGMLDGTKNSVQDMVGMKFHEHIKHITLDRHGYMASLWWYSEKQWRRLPEDLQAVVRDGFRELEATMRSSPARREPRAREQFERAGGKIHEPTPTERARFREATAGVRAWFNERYGAEWTQALDRAVAACRRTSL